MKDILPFCLKYDMLPHGGLILACVSGGADSMCLLDLLLTLSRRHDFSVAAAHFNHRLRGEESDGDEAFLREYCTKRGIPLYVGSGDVSGEAEKSGDGVEETARRLRYFFFYETAETIGAERIATAHNADDNAETVLLHLSRGAGLNGLCGIPPVRGKIVRPLLTVTRSEIEEYLSENGIPHREDSSNAEDDYARNRIRHHVTPVLMSINPSFSKAVLSSTELLRKDERFLSSLADEFIGEHLENGLVSRRELLSLPEPVSSRVIRKLCGDALSSEHVASVLALAETGKASSALSLPGMTVRCEYDGLRFTEDACAPFDPVELIPGRTAEIPELGLLFKCEKEILSGELNRSLTTFLFKSENICGNIVVRSRREGDNIRLSPASGNKSLKKLFIDKKIPAAKRDRIPVIADNEGVLAIPGVGCDMRMCPEAGDCVLKVTVEEIKRS